MDNYRNITSEFSVSAINALSAHIAILDHKGVILYVNQAWRDFAKSNGAPEDVHNSFKGVNYLEVCRSVDHQISQEAAQANAGILSVINNETPLFTLEYPCHSTTEVRWFILRVTRFHINDQLFIAVAHENITQRKLAEIQSKQLLKEKEVILKEVHHRIKNNISSIEGFLYAQMTLSNQKEVKYELQQALNRVKCMGLLYDEFMISEEYRYVSVRKYIHQIINLFKEIWSPSIDIKFKIDIDDFQLSQNKLVTLGIIINELMTNISKYAFVNRHSGQIDLKIKVDTNNFITLDMSDNGVGLSTLNNVENSSNLGTILVEMLIQQLGGTLTIKDEAGLKTSIKFKAANEVVRTSPLQTVN